MPRNGRKRHLFGWSLAGLVLLALAGIALLANSSLSLNVENARRGIEHRLGALTGRPVQVDGEASFRLLPRPVVELSGVRMGFPDDPRELRVARVIAQLDLLDALVGRTDVSLLTLVRPEFVPADDRDVHDDTHHAPQNQPPVATAPAATQAQQGLDQATHYLRMVLERFQGVRRIEVRDGLFRPREDAAGISNINLALEWDGRRQPAELAGSFVWNGQPADITISIAAPAAFLAGETSNLSAALRAPPVNLQFNGTGAGGTPFQLDGKLLLDAPSLARLGRWAGQPNLILPDFGSISIETNLHLAGDRAFLNQTSLALADMQAQGALEVAFPADGRPMLGGTLAFESFDFDAIGGAIAPLPRNVLELQRRIPLRFVRDFNLDLRLSASQSRLAGVAMNDLAATVKFAGGNAIVDIGDVSLYGGRAQGRVAIDANASAPRLTGTYTLQAINAGALAQRLSATDMQLTGSANVGGKLDIPIRNWAEIAQGNRVEARIEMAAGTIAGLPATAALEQGERSFGLQPGDGATSFDTLTARLSNVGGFLSIDALDITNPQGVMALQGLVALADSSASLDGVFRPANADIAEASGASFTSSKPIEFILRGEWPRLVVTVTPRTKPI